jgi:3-hydroxyisobutyrate dehydrogenase-like beta-hydroxyacid dehydrogenase
MRIGFIGLGNMGAAIARNLVEAGHQMTVYNRSREKAEPFAALGVQIADSPAQLCHGNEAVVTMLSDDAAVEQVVFGDDGLASALATGAAHISHSTISVSLARRLQREHAVRNQGYISSPVFGRPEAAANKQLIVVPAGPAELVERFRPLFNAIGRKTYEVGSEPWQANAIKLCGNFMIVSMLETFAEAFATMRKAGVDPHTFLAVMEDLFGSPVYKNYGRIMADEKFDPAGFALKLGAKDVRLVLEAAQEFSAPMPLASLIRDHFVDAIAHGQQDLDWSSLSRVLARNAGL